MEIRIRSAMQMSELTNHPGNSLDWLDRANLIVGIHNRYQCSPGRQKPIERFTVYSAYTIDRKHCNTPSPLLKVPSWPKDRWMFNWRCNDPTESLRHTHGRTDDRKRICFRTRCAKHNLVGSCIQESRNI